MHVICGQLHRGLQKEDVDANITLVNCAFEVWPDRVPSLYELAASIVRLDWHLSGDLLKVQDVTGDHAAEPVGAKDYKRVLQHARRGGSGGIRPARLRAAVRCAARRCVKRGLEHAGRPAGHGAPLCAACTSECPTCAGADPEVSGRPA